MHDQVSSWAKQLRNRPPQEVLHLAWQAFGRDAALSFSGAEDVALVAMAHEEGLKFPIFTLDTGRLPPATYRLLQAVMDKYAVSIDVFYPDPGALEPMVRQKGLFSFYQDGHGECCGIRKVAPLRRALAGRRAWLTGQRRDQSPTRQDIPEVHVDTSFSRPNQPLVKFNPLASWSLTQVWTYLRAAQVPVNELHHQGYVSIGCEPCTRALAPGEHERQARWWWEQETHRECGLHGAGNPSELPASLRSGVQR